MQLNLPNPSTASGVKYRSAANRRCIKTQIVPIALGADRRVIGILSERDIVRAFAEFSADALTKRVAQVMTREVATCGEAETAVSIMERMTTGRFRHIPVVELDQLVGLVSIGDVVKHRLWVLEQESAALHDYIQST